MDDNLHSPARQLIELRMRHAELDNHIDVLSHQPSGDELGLRRLKKQRLQLRDVIARLEADLDPRQPA